MVLVSTFPASTQIYIDAHREPFIENSSRLVAPVLVSLEPCLTGYCKSLEQ